MDGVTGNDYCVVHLKNNVKLFGGFSGSETQRSQRSSNDYPVVIDAEDSRRGVITHASQPVIMDGFIIRNGQVVSNPAKGGGVFVDSSSYISFIRCALQDNVGLGLDGTSGSMNGKDGQGGGFYCSAAKLFLSQCALENNIAQGGSGFSPSGMTTAGRGGHSNGGGIYLLNGQSYLVEVEITYNECLGGSGGSSLSSVRIGGSAFGAGIFASGGSIRMIKCHVGENSAQGGSGGLSLSYSDCGGLGGDAGGGGINSLEATTDLWMCILQNNHVVGGSGGTYTHFSCFGDGGNGKGGAIHYQGANLFSFREGVARDNKAAGGSSGTGGTGGNALGGGFYLCDGQLDCTSISGVFVGNSLQAGIGEQNGVSVGQEVYLCNNNSLLDSDNDGLPCWFEEEQGCSTNEDDAALQVWLDFPNPGASFRSLPISLLGRVASPEVSYLERSIDGGATFLPIGAPNANLEWDGLFQSGEPGNYSIVIRSRNNFGGMVTSEPRPIRYHTDAPQAYILTPLHQSPIKGQAQIHGTATSGSSGFGGYVLEYVAGVDPEVTTGWDTIGTFPNEVSNSNLGVWNVLALPEGWYIVRLRVSDGAGTESKTWVTVYVTRDELPPSSPEWVSIKGVYQTGITTDGGMVSVSGQGSPDCVIHEAVVVNETESVIGTVTSSLTLHRNGALRGYFQVPQPSGASQIALRVRLKDRAGNIGASKTTNVLVLDNTPPVVRVSYLPNNAIIQFDPIYPKTYLLTGVSFDQGCSGLKKVELRINGGPLCTASGTSTWAYPWRPASPGAYSLAVTALDLQGNRSNAVGIDITVDISKPTCYIKTPYTGTSYYSGSIIDIEGSASDTIDFRDFQLLYKNTNDPDWTLITPQPITTPVSDGQLAQWNTEGLTGQSYQVQLVVRDYADNISTHSITINLVSELTITGIPDVIFNEDAQRLHYAYLPAYVIPSVNAENYSYSPAEPLPPTGMGIWIDEAHWLHIQPEPNWFGWADVHVRVDDGQGREAVDTFRVQIININDRPTDPEVSINPSLPGTYDPLECLIIAESFDPDNDPIQYQYNWYRSSNGVTFSSAPLRSVRGFALYDILSPSMTLPGQYWRCVVRAYDGAVFSEGNAYDTVRILQSSSITINLSSQSITLGQYLTVSGEISGLSGSAPVTFRTTYPDGRIDPAYPLPVLSANNGYYEKIFAPQQASEGRSPWLIQASWNGDNNYRGAESNVIAFNVNKAQPNLTLSISHTSVLLNLVGANDFKVTAQLSISGCPPELLGLLQGNPIRISIQTPDGQTPWAPLTALTDSEGKAVFDAQTFGAAGVAFDLSGQWRFKAEFTGNHNLKSAVTQDFDITPARVTVKEGVGYVVLVLGRIDAYAEGHAEHAQTVNFIYDTLLSRGFIDDDIYYLREFLGEEYDPGYPVDGTPTADALKYAVEIWARNKMLASPAPLFIILVNHGGLGIFHMDIGHTGPQEFVSAEQIDEWLSVLQSSLGQSKISAAQQPITMIYGACYSGSFIPVLSGQNRIIITSSASDEITYRGVVNSETGLRDGDFFLMEFFRNAREGRTLKNAFESACNAAYVYTSERSGSTANPPQHPQLDDNGDGIGTSGSLSEVFGFDGALAAGLDLGMGVNAGNTISCFAARPPLYITPGGSIGTGLWVESTGRNYAQRDEAWVEIKTPNYDSGTIATPGYENFQRVALMKGPIPCTHPPEILGPGRTRFYWQQLDITAYMPEGFNLSGTYKVYYFLRDGQTGNVGAYLVTNIYVSQANNQPPPPTTLLYPVHNGIVNPTLFLGWTEVFDPNGDAVTYRVEVSSDPSFPEGTTIIKDGLASTIITLSPADGIQNDQDYYWRVIPTDIYGAYVPNPTVRVFRVRGNPGVPGAITGSIVNSNNRSPIQNATVTVVPTLVQTVSSVTGNYFIGNISQGIYNLRVSAPGYKMVESIGVIVSSSRVTIVNFALEPELSNQAPVWLPTPNVRGRVNQLISFPVAAEEYDSGQSLTYAAYELPSGATFDPIERKFSWIPDASAVRNMPYEVVFVVTDNGNPPISVEMTVTIHVSHEPVIVGPSYAVLGEVVTLVFQGDALEIPWQVLWEHEGQIIHDENDDTLVIEGVTYEDAGWYRATQVPSEGKAEFASAIFYLQVYERVPTSSLPIVVIAILFVLLSTWKTRSLSKTSSK